MKVWQHGSPCPMSVKALWVHSCIHEGLCVYMVCVYGVEIKNGSVTGRWFWIAGEDSLSGKQKCECEIHSLEVK